MSQSTSKYLLVGLLVVFLGLGATYASVMPPFENPDESSHLMVVRYTSQNWRLQPLVTPTGKLDDGAAITRYLEYSDPPSYYAPPAYYFIASALTFWSDLDDLPNLLVPNPGWELGWALTADASSTNKNMYAHRVHEETWAASDTMRAIYVLRGFSLLLGGVIVSITFFTAQKLFPDYPGLWIGAAVVAGLNPQFLAQSASITNDTLHNALFSLALLAMVSTLKTHGNWRCWAGIGALVGLAALTKQTALLLFAPAGISLIYNARQEREQRFAWRTFLLCGSAFGLASILVGGWWYLRNGFLYADPLGLTPHFGTQVPLPYPFDLSALLWIFRTAWGNFGWALILLDPQVYTAVGILVLAALAGAVWTLRPRGEFWAQPVETRLGLLILLLAFGLNLVALIRWSIATGALLGRLLFPSSVAISVLLAWGLSAWLRWRPLRWAAAALVLLAACFAAAVPWITLRPAFSAPLAERLPEAAIPLNKEFETGVRLIGYEVDPQDLAPGQTLRVVLYWRAEAPPGERLRSWVQIGPWNAVPPFALQDVFVGGTYYPSDLWEAGDIIRQEYLLALPDWLDEPRLAWLRVGLVRMDERRLGLAPGATIPQLGPLDPTVGTAAAAGPWRVIPASIPPPACITDVRFNDGIRLVGYDITQGPNDTGLALRLTLYWQADEPVETNYLIRAQLFDEAGGTIAADLTPPKDGEYPTSWWLPGQVVSEHYDFQLDTLPGSPVSARVGLHRSATLESEFKLITTLIPGDKALQDDSCTPPS